MEEFTATRSGSKADRILELCGRMTIHHASEIKSLLLEAIAGAKKLDCNLERISQIDLTGLQLLCAAHRAALDNGKSFTVHGLDGEAIQPVLAETGFPRHIGCVQDKNKSCLWVGGEK